MMSSLLAVARTAPASEDGVQLGGVKRPRVLTVRIPLDRPRRRAQAKKPGAGRPPRARLIVGPDDVRDVGAGNERYNAVAPSGSGVGSEVDSGHSKSSPGPRLRLRASLPGPPQRQRAPMSRIRRVSA